MPAPVSMRRSAARLFACVRALCTAPNSRTKFSRWRCLSCRTCVSVMRWARRYVSSRRAIDCACFWVSVEPLPPPACQAAIRSRCVNILSTPFCPFFCHWGPVHHCPFGRRLAALASPCVTWWGYCLSVRSCATLPLGIEPIGPLARYMWRPAARLAMTQVLRYCCSVWCGVAVSVGRWCRGGRRGVLCG
ncbi:hypothetical protein D3C87_1025930 [compost metagenome]